MIEHVGEFVYIAEYVWKYNPRADSERIKKFKNHPVIGKNFGGEWDLPHDL
jgi:hypothetical protein